jgi:hypothetical protein
VTHCDRFLRVGSKVTLQRSGRDAVLQTPDLISQLANVVDQHPKSKVYGCTSWPLMMMTSQLIGMQALVIRVYFVLGNLVAADEDVRHQVLSATNNGARLLQQLDYHAGALLSWADTEEGEATLSDGLAPTCEQVDVVIKVRTFKNLRYVSVPYFHHSKDYSLMKLHAAGAPTGQLEHFGQCGRGPCARRSSQPALLASISS